jgi:dTDP-4-dehydrorhamnose reductase
MVGRAVTDYCRSEGDEVFAYDHATLDISDQLLVRETLEKAKPEAVINCAAWTDVDGCEREPARAKTDNTEGPENLAIASRAVGALLITISTDYVFDGVREGFYTQRDDPNPQSVYGLSKLNGERRAQLSSARTVVVRSGFIFGPGGSNFLSSLAERIRRGEKITAIADAWGTPTYSRHLAARLRELAQLDLPGIYHVVNSGAGASYAEFGRAVAEALGHDQSLVGAANADQLKRPAPRPRNSRLRCLLSESLGLTPLPDWRAAVRDFVAVV